MSFETLIEERMKRFHILLDNSNFNFKKYQYDGVQWCISNELRPNPTVNFRGGFIADEMGLGKTILMIGTMFCNFLPKTLIVVPPVLIQQWYKEIFKATGHKTILYHGINKKKITLEQLNNAPIVLTTYNSLIPDKCLLKNIPWNRIIYDEAHHLRNARTRRFINCRSLRARVRWLVTGTPVQNKKQDFYNLCFAAGMNPNFYAEPNNLPIIVNNFILRRTKKQVGINLPSVNKNNCSVEWNNIKEKMLSEEIHSLLPSQTGVSSDKKRKLAEIFGTKGALTAILRARQSCILPSLMRKTVELFKKLGYIDNDYVEALDYTSKIDAVIKLISNNKDNGKGKLIFCHYRDEIDIIKNKLVINGYSKDNVFSYDGRNTKKLNSILDSVVEGGTYVLIIQIQTGCEGLNLQANFSEIYFVSPHWNPSIEDQAIARCHRIGQTKAVEVFKFEMDGFSGINDNDISLEKYVNKVQDFKREISKQFLAVQ
jgi:SNF2 family DNA or RNA helicase